MNLAILLIAAQVWRAAPVEAFARVTLAIALLSLEMQAVTLLGAGSLSSLVLVNAARRRDRSLCVAAGDEAAAWRRRDAVEHGAAVDRDRRARGDRGAAGHATAGRGGSLPSRSCRADSTARHARIRHRRRHQGQHPRLVVRAPARRPGAGAMARRSCCSVCTRSSASPTSRWASPPCGSGCRAGVRGAGPRSSSCRWCSTSSPSSRTISTRPLRRSSRWRGLWSAPAMPPPARWQPPPRLVGCRGGDEVGRLSARSRHDGLDCVAAWTRRGRAGGSRARWVGGRRGRGAPLHAGADRAVVRASARAARDARQSHDGGSRRADERGTLCDQPGRLRRADPAVVARTWRLGRYVRRALHLGSRRGGRRDGHRPPSAARPSLRHATWRRSRRCIPMPTWRTASCWRRAFCSSPPPRSRPTATTHVRGGTAVSSRSRSSSRRRRSGGVCGSTCRLRASAWSGSV